MPSPSPLLIVLLGPTASGKSALAMSLAPPLGGEIVNCDSMQMVRFLDIGTAKPTAEERKAVPHHLFDLIEPSEFFSAGAYMEVGRRVCREIAERGGTPIVVGGTGLYLRALLEGIFEGPGRSPALRSRLQRIARHRGTGVLYNILVRRDPKALETIGAGDLLRIIRALEVMKLSGRRITDVQAETTPLEGFTILKLGLDLAREELYDRINRRVERMFGLGLIDEVKDLLGKGYSPDAKGFEALGYRKALEVAQGSLPVEEAIRLTQRDTRRYAKRQMTWFRKEPGVVWLHSPGESPETRQRAWARINEARGENGTRADHRT